LNVEDNQDIVSAYKTIESELAQYNSKLLEKPIIIVANKIDCEGAEHQLHLLKKSVVKKDIFVISAKNKQNTKELVDKIYKEFKQLKFELDKKSKTKPIKIYELKKQPDYNSDVEIVKIDEHI
jgi:GTP-binding protein